MARPLLVAAAGLVPSRFSILGENSKRHRTIALMSFHRRRLPHQYPRSQPLFITWHLHGSLPHGVYPPPGKMSDGQAFVWMDRYLDTTRVGPMFLKDDRIAQIVVQSLFTGQNLGHYVLHAYAIMANHVHVLVTPLVSPSRLLGSLKGVTAREANKLLRRTGESFWQHESYDHWVRDAKEFERIRPYIEDNPVKAGLVSEPSAYPWSSAHRDGTSPAAATTSGRAT